MLYRVKLEITTEEVALVEADNEFDAIEIAETTETFFQRQKSTTVVSCKVKKSKIVEACKLRSKGYF
jgi:hypothetical protein